MVYWGAREVYNMSAYNLKTFLVTEKACFQHKKLDANIHFLGFNFAANHSKHLNLKGLGLLTLALKF